MLHSLFDGKVYDCFFVSIIDACDSAKVGLLVIGLDFVYNFRRKILQRHVLIVAKEFFSANKNLVDCFSIDFYHSVCNFHTRKFLYKVFEHTPFWHLEGTGIEDECVFFYFNLFYLGGHYCLLQFNVARSQHHCAHGHGALCLFFVYCDFLIEIAIAYV